MEKISWTDCVWNENILHRVKEERSILQTMKIRKANWIGHTLHSNCLLKHVIKGKAEGGTEVMGRWVRRCMQLLNDVKEMGGCWKLKKGALNCTRWSICIAGGLDVS
jgi:hypothetical protein